MPPRVSLTLLALAIGCHAAAPDEHASAGVASAGAAGRAAEAPPAQRYGPSHAASDPRAIEIAEAVLAELGGREAWERTRCVAWSFFGGRRHWWDRHEGLSRIETEDAVLVLDLDTGEGRAWRGGEEVTDPEELSLALEQARRMWVNDSYWMFMPYKLLDPGVVLTYVGRETTRDGREAECLQLTFEGVGDTPQNAYRVRVPLETGRVEEWSFWEDAADLGEEPAFTMPWSDWRRHGDIWLAGGRGRGADWDIAVLDEPPADLFTTPDRRRQQPVEEVLRMQGPGPREPGE